MRFDPYREWLDIPDGPRPPHPYALLGLPTFERDAERIATAANERARQIRRRATFDRIPESKLLLAEVRAATAVLNDPERRRRFELQLRRADKPAAEGRTRRRPATWDEPDRRAGGHAWMIAGAGGLVAVGVASVVVWSVGQMRRTASAPASVAAQRSDDTERQDDIEIAPVRNGKVAPAGAVDADTQAHERPVVVDKLPDDAVDEPAAFPLPPLPAIPRSVAKSPRVDAERPPVEAKLPLPSRQDWQAVARRALPAWSPVEAPRPQTVSLATYRFPSFQSSRDADVYASHLLALLERGFAPGPGDRDDVLKHYRSAAGMTRDTAFADYAMGLVHLKRMRLDEAAASFEASRRPGDRAFLPAWQAFLQLELRRNRRDAVRKEATAFATVLAQATGDDDRMRERDAALRWLGRLTAVLETPWERETLLSQELRETDTAVRKALGPLLVPTYEDGRRSLRADVAVRSEEFREAIDRLADTHNEERALALEEMTAERETIHDRLSEVDRRVDDERRALLERTAEFEAELGKLKPLYEQYSNQVQSAQAALALIDTQIARDLEIPAGDRPPIADYGSSRLLVLRQQAQATYRQAVDRFTKVRLQVESLSTQRQHLVTRHERDVRSLAAERSDLLKREAALGRRAAKTGAVEASDLPGIQGYQRRLGDVAGYMPFDPEVEARKILDALRRRELSPGS